jgi:Uma2 family endonuclease
MVQVQPGSTLRTPMSPAEYAELGEAKFHEYYDGCLVVNPPTVRHALVATRLVAALMPHCEGRLLVAGSGWGVGGEIFIPDVMVIDVGSGNESLVVRPPHLVIEILSPSTKDVDWGKKLDAYGRGAAEWYWIVDLGESSVSVLENREGSFVRVVRTSAAATLPPLGAPVDLRTLVVA